jgi:hypothetical protein
MNFSLEVEKSGSYKKYIHIQVGEMKQGANLSIVYTP